MDNSEAKELRMMVVLRGGDGLETGRVRRALVDSVDRVGHELGASSVAVTFDRVPGWADPSGVHETEVDWVVE